MISVTNESEIKLIDRLIDSALKYVVFDGWSDQTLKKVSSDLKLDRDKINRLFPRGGIDLALAFHKRNDDRFVKELANSDFIKKNKRIRDKIEYAINTRLEIAAENKEAVKRSVALLSTPIYLSDGIKALWATSDKIWIAIGDKTNDLNWYSKRVILSSVYSATIVFWIEDESKDFSETRAFINRRINDVMVIERAKGNLKNSSFWKDFVKKSDTKNEDIFGRKGSFPGL